MKDITLKQIEDIVKPFMDAENDKRNQFQWLLIFFFNKKFLNETKIIEQVKKKGVPEKVLLPGGDDRPDWVSDFAKVCTYLGVNVSFYKELKYIPIFSFKMDLELDPVNISSRGKFYEGKDIRVRFQITPVQL